MAEGVEVVAVTLARMAAPMFRRLPPPMGVARQWLVGNDAQRCCDRDDDKLSWRLINYLLERSSWHHCNHTTAESQDNVTPSKFRRHNHLCFGAAFFLNIFFQLNSGRHNKNPKCFSFSRIVHVVITILPIITYSTFETCQLLIGLFFSFWKP